MSKQTADLSRTVWRSIEVREFFGCGTTKGIEIVNSKDFPQPFYAGRGKLWFGADVQAWARRKADEANTQEEETNSQQ